MLNEPAGLRPRLREDCSVLAGRVSLPGCSAVASFGRHWVLDSDRGLRKSRKPVHLRARLIARITVGDRVSPGMSILRRGRARSARSPNNPVSSWPGIAGRRTASAQSLSLYRDASRTV